MKIKGFFILVLMLGILGIAIAEEKTKCDKKVAETYVKRNNAFVRDSSIHTTACPTKKPATRIQGLPDVSLGEKMVIATKVLAKMTLGEIKEMPGGCSSIEECEAFCLSDLGQMEECLAFAEKHKILSAGDLEEAKRITLTLASAKKGNGGGFKPPTCLPGNKCM